MERGGRFGSGIIKLDLEETKGVGVQMNLI
jgi:hypothetical protein